MSSSKNVYTAVQYRAVDFYTGGHVLQVIAQFLYGYGYSTPFGFEFVNPKVDCGLADFEAALAQYDFLNNPDTSQGKKSRP